MKFQGKVNVVRGEEVTVSLFTPEGEVVGELSKAQFPPRASLEPGQCFTYKATKKDGKDEVTITLPKKRRICAKEFARLKRQVEKMIPKGEF